MWPPVGGNAADHPVAPIPSARLVHVILLSVSKLIEKDLVILGRTTGPWCVPCFWVAAFEVIDQLCQVFNRVDVVVGRGADQADTRGAVTGHCNVTSHLLARQLTTLSWLGTLHMT